MISEAFPEKIFKTIPVTGISLLITPLVMSGLHEGLLGVRKAAHDHPASFLGTFLGGALFGLAAAGTRLLIIT